MSGSSKSVRPEPVEGRLTAGRPPFDRLRANGGEAILPVRFSGHAALFDVVDRAGDVFRAGAFAGAGRVPLLRNHRGPAVGEVVVCEDERGLRIEGAADGVCVGDGLSVGYRPVRVRQGARRELLLVELVEVSLVAMPMQPGARVERTGPAPPPLAQVGERSPSPSELGEDKVSTGEETWT